MTEWPASRGRAGSAAGHDVRGDVDPASVATVTVRVPLAIRWRRGRRTVVTPEALAGTAPVVPTRADPALIKALARAFRYQRLLDEGRYATITEMAAAERLDRGYLGALLRLTLLAPDLVEAALTGQQANEPALPKLTRTLPMEWAEQRHATETGS